MLRETDLPGTVLKVCDRCMGMHDLTVTVLNIGLGTFFSLVGLIKLYPKLLPDVHNEIKASFPGHVEVSPLTALGVEIDPYTYMLIIGATELILGMLLIIGPSAIKLLSNIILIAIMVGAVHAHVAQGDTKFIPAAVCFLLLGFRLMLSTSFPSYALIDDDGKKRQ